MVSEAAVVIVVDPGGVCPGGHVLMSFDYDNDNRPDALPRSGLTTINGALPWVRTLYRSRN